MTERILFGVCAAVAGVAAAVQAASNSGLAARIGLGPALVVNTVIVMIGVLGLYFAKGPRTEFFPAGASWTLYLGGICGFIIIAAAAFVFPKIGAASSIALMVLGQGAAALAIDHFGLMGMPKDPVTLSRAAGVALVAAGAVLLKW